MIWILVILNHSEIILEKRVDIEPPNILQKITAADTAAGNLTGWYSNWQNLMIEKRFPNYGDSHRCHHRYRFQERSGSSRLQVKCGKSSWPAANESKWHHEVAAAKIWSAQSFREVVINLIGRRTDRSLRVVRPIGLGIFQAFFWCLRCKRLVFVA